MNVRPKSKMRFLTYRLHWAEQLFIKYRKHLKYIQLAMFFAFLYLVIAPLFSTRPTFDDTILTSTILLSQFLFWGLWYGACLFSVIIFGRLWCGALCPLGALSEWVGLIGLKKPLPKWVQWDGWLVILFTVVTILGQTMDVRDDAWGLAKLFLYIFSLAIIVGYLFGQHGGRPWCRYFCPIGKILGVVSRLSIINFMPNNGVKEKPASQPSYIQGRLCPTDYNLPYKNSSNNCITCGACVSDKKKAGLGIYLQKPAQEAKYILLNQPNKYEILFILISPGLAAGGFLWLILHQYQVLRDSVGGWFMAHNIFSIFNQASSFISSQAWNQHFTWFDVGLITSYMLGYGIIVGILSALLLAASAWLVVERKHNFKKAFILLTYQCIPIAILSIVIGLCGKFFEVMHHDFGLSLKIAAMIKFSLLLGSMLWSLWLTATVIFGLIRQINLRFCLSLTFILLYIAMIFYLWWPATLGHAYMSEVEKIRQHIVIPK